MRIARDVQTFEIDRLAKRAPVFARDKNKFVRLFVRGDERAKKIRGNPPAAPADARHRPRDRFAEQILFAEDRREPRRQRDRKGRGPAHVGRGVQLREREPDSCFHRAQDFRREIKKRRDAERENRKGQDGIVVNEDEPAEDGNVFRHAQPDVRERLGRTVRHQARGGFRRVRDETGGTGEQHNEHIQNRRVMTEHLDREQSAADRPDDGVNGVPGGIEPRDFVGEKFEEIKNAGDDDDPGLAENFERLEIRREDNPVLMDGETGDENGQVEIEAGETGEAERDAQQAKSFHARISDAACDCHEGFAGAARLTARRAVATAEHARHPLHPRTARLCEKPARHAWRR